MNVIPKIVKYPEKGSPCSIASNWVIGAPSTLKKYALMLHADLKDILGLELKFNNSKTSETIKLKLNTKACSEAESFNIAFYENSIELVGHDEQGLFYAIQTLKQILLVHGNNIAACSIHSLKGYSWRGMHLDVSRHFFPIPYLKKLIDLMALFSLNRFHWHLTDDQGWRIESKKFPLLHQVGSCRDEDGYREPQYYTQEEIKDFVAYAEERFVEVIPEIDMPGHTQSVLAAYPNLSCTGEPTQTWTKWGVSEEVLCMGKDNTYDFAEELLNEVIPLFKSKYFHIGGDECPDTAWQKCPHCQKKKGELGLHDFRALQHQFTNFLSEVLKKHDKIMIGWDEITEGQLPDNTVVMAWRGNAGKAAINAISQGKNVIFTPNSSYYLDWRQSDKEGEPGGFGVTDLKKVFQYDPQEIIKIEELQYTHNSTKSDLKLYFDINKCTDYFLGIQVNLWTERIHNEKELKYMLFPRLLALAEQAGSRSTNKDYIEFSKRAEIIMEKVLKHYL